MEIFAQKTLLTFVYASSYRLLVADTDISVDVYGIAHIGLDRNRETMPHIPGIRCKPV